MLSGSIFACFSGKYLSNSSSFFNGRKFSSGKTTLRRELAQLVYVNYYCK